MKRNITRLAGLLLALCLAITGCTLPWESGNGNGGQSGRSSGNRRLVDFHSIEYVRPDVDALKAQITSTVAAMEAAEDFDTFAEASLLADDLWEEFSTMYIYANIQSYLNVNDEFYDEEYRYLDDAYVEIGILNDDLVRLLVEGPYADEYREAVGDYSFQQLQNSLLLSDPAIEPLEQERNTITTDYNSLFTNLTLEYEGKAYTMEEIMEVGNPYARYEMYTEYYRQNAPIFTEMYARLIELDKQKAEILGFDTPAEMYYLSYSRDYSPTDALQLTEALRGQLGGLVSSVMTQSSARITVEYDRAFDAMPTLLQSIDGELVRAWNDMVEYNLYDFTAGPDKMDVGFTTYLYAYDAPFTYVYYTDDIGSAFTVVHEFGHFFDNWLHYDSASSGSLDVAETYSQGLEVLAHPYLELFTRDAEAAVLYNLGEFMESIMYQALLEEFQLRAYELAEITPDALAELYLELQYDYGFGDFVTPALDGLDHSWFRITHMFEVPFYTISYTTSAMAALQIWAIAQESETDAVDTYMKMIHQNQSQGFVELLASVGLGSPFEAETIEEIAGYYREAFKGNRKAIA